MGKQMQCIITFVFSKRTGLMAYYNGKYYSGTIYTPSDYNGKSLLSTTGNMGSANFEVNVNGYFKVTWNSNWGSPQNLTITALKNCHIVGSFSPDGNTVYSVDSNYTSGQSFYYTGIYSSALQTNYFTSAEIVAY